MLKDIFIPQNIKKFCGSSAYTSLATKTLPYPPSAPLSLSAIVTSTTSVRLNWIDNTLPDQSNDESEFVIERATSLTGTWTVYSVASNSTELNISGLIYRKTYYFRIFSKNSAGQSDYSDTVSVRIAKPTTPGSLIATEGSSTQIQLTWADRSNNEDGFIIMQKVGRANWTEIDRVSTGVTSYESHGLAPNTTYRYKIIAYNAIGNSRAAASSRRKTLP